MELNDEQDTATPDEGASSSHFDPLDVSNWIEGAIVGGAMFIAQFVNTLWLMSVAPRYIVRLIEENPTHRRLVHPFTFLFLPILPVALAFEYWELPQFAESLSEPDDFANRFQLVAIMSDLQQLTTQEFFLQTAPTAFLVLAAAFLVTRLLGDRKPLTHSPLVAIICYVVGYRLFVRLCQAALDLLLLPIIPLMEHGSAEEQVFFGVIALCLIVPIVLLMVYGFFVAGWPTMYAALRRWGSGWLVRGRIMTAITSGAICFVVYVPSVFTPALIGMVQQMQVTDAIGFGNSGVDNQPTPSHSAEATTMTNHYANDELRLYLDDATTHDALTLHLLHDERLVYDGRSHLLIAPIMIRNESPDAIVIRTPQFVSDAGRTRDFYCRLVGRDSVDEYDLLRPGEVALWQIMVYLPETSSGDDPLRGGMLYQVEYLPSHVENASAYETETLASQFASPLSEELAALFARQRATATTAVPPR